MNESVLLISALLTATAGIGTAQSAEKLGEHPAVIVARNWSAKSLDPNTFIVAHPARLELLAASPTTVKEGTEVQAAAVSAAAGK